MKSIITLPVGSPPRTAHNPSPFHYENEVSVNPILSWDPGDGTEFHRVYFGSSNPPDSVGEQAENQYQPGILEHGAAYYWRIDEVNVNGSTTGQVWKFITEESTGPGDYLSDPGIFSFHLYPNPLHRGPANLEYSIGVTSGVRISIIDIYGRIIRSEDIGIQPPGQYHHQMDFSGLNAGAYLIRIHTVESFETVRMILLDN